MVINDYWYNNGIIMVSTGIIMVNNGYTIVMVNGISSY